MDTLSNKKHELAMLIDIYKPDVLVITETLPKNCDIKPTEAEYDIKNYDLHTNFNSSTCRRGVCVYVKDIFKSAKVYEKENKFTESVWCEVKMSNNDILLIGGVYRSPNSATNNTLELNTFLRQLKIPSHLLIAGDFNYPDIDWCNMLSTKPDDHAATQFLEVVQDCFLFQNVKHPTHYRANQDPTLIDLLFTNEEDMIYEVKHLPPLGLSHHSGLLFDYRCYSAPSTCKAERVIYKYYAGDYNNMRKFLEDYDIYNKVKDKTAQEAWDIIDNILLEAANKFIPKYRIDHNRPPPPPWMNDKVRNKSKMKREAFELMKTRRDEPSRKYYARVRNQCKWETRKAVRQYEQQVAKDSKKNPKSFYKYVQSKTRVRAGVPDLTYNNVTACSDYEKAETLNNFYKGVFTLEDKDHVPSPTNIFPGPNLMDIEITEDMVKKKLDELNHNKSPGSDGHHPRILSEMKEILIKPLTHLFKLSLSEGYLPNSWREANITPIFKNKGNRSQPTNYRPVSLTSVICKLLESLIKDAIIDHLLRFNLLYKHQHAFIGKRSCTTQLLEALDNWTKLLEDEDTVDVVYLDFAKAFDTVPHLRLIEKLKALGINGRILKWISAFLIRRQRVIVNGSPSKWTDVESGVPQGSVLGPVLFIIFINDMPNQIDNFISLFADDTKLYGRSTTTDKQSSIQNDLSKLQVWSDTWKLHFNESKCTTIYLGKENNKHTYNMLSTNGPVNLAESDAEKDLGVFIDNGLTFDKHITEAIKKANNKLGMIKRSFVYLDKDMLCPLYTALVRPLLEYGNVIWSPHLQQHIKALEAVQHRATRLIPGLCDLPYEERLRKLNLPSLSYRRMRGDMVEVYKYCHGLYQVDKKPFNLMSDINEESITRDNGFKIYKEKSQTAVRTNFFGNRVANIWNSLPTAIVQAPSLNSFKSRLDKLWKPHMFTEDMRTVPHRTNSLTLLVFDDQ